jgi:hypothetical protein
MRFVGRVWSSLLERGQLSRAGYQLLTGLVMLYVAWLLSGVREDDAAAGPVALVLGFTGFVLAVRGGRTLLSSRRASRARSTS